jgi:hypothetical protein
MATNLGANRLAYHPHVRRLLLLVFVLFLVNLPYVDQTITGRKLDRSGTEVEATVLRAQHAEHQNYVDYRLPEEIDPKRTRYSAQVDDATYEQARTTKVLAVRVLPDQPSTNRPDGVARNATFLVVALLGDVVLLAIALLWWRRRRRWHRHEVLEVGDGSVTLRVGGRTLTAAAPEHWTQRVRAGRVVGGSLHLVAEQDLVAGPPLSGLESFAGGRCVVHGRVLDTRAGWALLELDDGFRLRVETGPHRIRADIRDSTEASGLLCFTP